MLLTIHYMEEVAEADDIIIINHGSITAHGSTVMLKETRRSNRMTVVSKDKGLVTNLLDPEEDKVHYPRRHGGNPPDEDHERHPRRGYARWQGELLEVRTGTLDDTFIGVTKEEME